MYWRPVIGWAILWLAIASPALAQITAFWQQVPITPQATANDPQLASMQCWDLMTTTSGDWHLAGMRAALPAGSLFYRHQMGAFRKPPPVPGSPALAFTTYVSSPHEDGANNNTLLLGGWLNEPMSLGDATSPNPGTFSISWGDQFVDLSGTYQIARLTFPKGLLPDIDNSSPPVTNISFTAQVSPDFTTEIPDIPEPACLWIATLAVLRVPFTRQASRRWKFYSGRRSSFSETGQQSRLLVEPLESRQLLSFTATFPNGGTFSQHTDENASNSPGHEAETLIVVNPTNPRNIVAFAIGFAGGMTLSTVATGSTHSRVAEASTLLITAPSPLP